MVEIIGNLQDNQLMEVEMADIVRIEGLIGEAGETTTQAAGDITDEFYHF